MCVQWGFWSQSFGSYSFTWFGYDWKPYTEFPITCTVHLGHLVPGYRWWLEIHGIIELHFQQESRSYASGTTTRSLTADWWRFLICRHTGRHEYWEEVHKAKSTTEQFLFFTDCLPFLSNTMVLFRVRTHLWGLVKYIISRRFQFLLQCYGETGTL